MQAQTTRPHREPSMRRGTLAISRLSVKLERYVLA